MHKNQVDIDIINYKFSILEKVKSDRDFFYFLIDYVVFLKQYPPLFKIMSCLETEKKEFYKEFWELEKKLYKEFTQTIRKIVKKSIELSLLHDPQIQKSYFETNPLERLKSFHTGHLKSSGKTVFNCYNYIIEACVFLEEKNLLSNIFFQNEETKNPLDANWILKKEYEHLLNIFKENEEKKVFKNFYSWGFIKIVPEVHSWDKWTGPDDLQTLEEDHNYYTDYIQIAFGLLKDSLDEPKLANKRKIYFDLALKIHQYILDSIYCINSNIDITIDLKTRVVESKKLNKNWKLAKNAGPYKCIELLVNRPASLSEIGKIAWNAEETDRVRIEISKLNRIFHSKFNISSSIIIRSGTAGVYKLNDSEFNLRSL